ncbi:hypothetical protein NC651_025831 [Populus alba x Populus x berolinensis]|nr:hypothetical protein NC651_025831 [Populus alba x Populus x berolinensis]
MEWIIWTLMRTSLMLPKCNTTAPMLINYQMLAVVVVAFSSSQKQASSRPRCACRLWENKNHSAATNFPALMVFLWMLRVMHITMDVKGNE